MMKKLSIEEVKEMLTTKYSTECKKFVEDAIENGCEFYFDHGLYAVKRIDKLKDIRDTCVGILLSIWEFGNEVHTYVAVDDSGGLRDWLNLGEYAYSESFSSVIAKSLEEAGTCNLCNQHVGYKDIHQYSFAGKCCSKCKPKAKEKYEQPGWYN